MIDRLGNCPHCGIAWDAGDIYEQLNKLDTFTHVSSDEVKKLARSMGWSEEHKSRFTKLVVKDYRDCIVLVCPNCGMQYNAVTGEQINNNQNSNRDGDKDENQQKEEEATQD